MAETENATNELMDWTTYAKKEWMICSIRIIVIILLLLLKGNYVSFAMPQEL
jgi:hypothetical protein